MYVVNVVNKWLDTPCVAAERFVGSVSRAERRRPRNTFGAPVERHSEASSSQMQKLRIAGVYYTRSTESREARNARTLTVSGTRATSSNRVYIGAVGYVVDAQ